MLKKIAHSIQVILIIVCSLELFDVTKNSNANVIFIFLLVNGVYFLYKSCFLIKKLLKSKLFKINKRKLFLIIALVTTPFIFSEVISIIGATYNYVSGTKSLYKDFGAIITIIYIVLFIFIKKVHNIYFDNKYIFYISNEYINDSTIIIDKINIYENRMLSFITSLFGVELNINIIKSGLLNLKKRSTTPPSLFF